MWVVREEGRGEGVRCTYREHFLSEGVSNAVGLS